MTNVVYRTPDSSNRVYHTDRECPHLRQKGGIINALHVDNINQGWRVCDYCKYRHIPEL